MAEDMGEKTELPSERRLHEARERGQVVRSTDLSAAIDLLAGVTVMVIFGGGLVRAMATVMRRLFTEGAFTLSEPTLPVVAREVIWPCAAALAPMLGLIVLAALAANLGQVGLFLSPQALMPRFDKLSPAKGVQNIMGKRNLIRTLISVLKLIVTSWVGYTFLKACVSEVATLSGLPAVDGMYQIARMAVRLALWLLALLLAIGVIDYLYQRWQHTQDLKMTRQEVMDERRSMEGDPQVKGRRMRMMRQIAMQQINAAVPKADVIVTNPTHYSVAIEYDAESMHAPRVVAKGVDFMAMRIRQVAALHGVPIVERPPLARALHAEVEVGQEVRPEFYQAVAEILAYVYRLEKEAAAVA
ncbi:MAG: flagellar biosynthesis protein FlhB [Phycisphaerales bacterium]